MQREWAIKQLTRKDKLLLIEQLQPEEDRSYTIHRINEGLQSAQ